MSDILESNGSSSMATVCAGTLALMDAGVPIKAPVSGIAMGLIKNPGEEKYAVLSDILGDEDHLGDMDFKTTGTAKGLTATQMDIKCDGLSYEILEKALAQAKQAREHILGKILETMDAPRAELKPHVPRIEAFEIPKEFIGAVIRPGGKIIQGMQEETGATITIEEEDGVGKIQVSGPQQGKHRRSHRTDSRHRCHSRSRRSLRCQGNEHHALRLLRRVHAGQGRLAPHL